MGREAAPTTISTGSTILGCAENLFAERKKRNSNRDHRTLLDKMILLLTSLGLNQPFYFVADAYYGRPAPSMARRM